MSPPSKNLNLPPIEEIYDLWLYERLSLRKIGARFGCSRTAIWSKLRQRYGEGATAPRKQSLARTMAEEYGKENRHLVNQARGKEGRFFSARKENNLTRYQSLDFVDNFPTDEPTREYQEGFKLPLFIWFTKALLKILY